MQDLNRINRLEATARLAGVTGSALKRNHLASSLNKRFYLLTRDIFEKRAKIGVECYITPKELENRFQKLVEGVKIEVAKNTHKDSSGSISADIDDFCSNKILGYYMTLPFEMVKHDFGLKKDRIETLCHESRHFFDFVTQPKYAASMHKFEMLEHTRSHWKVYKKNLYGDTALDLSKEEALSGIKNSINDHFESMGTPLSERITVLQEFRYSLQSESNAKKDGIFYCLKPKFEDAKGQIKKDQDVEINLKSLDLHFDSENYGTKTQKMKALKKCEKIAYDYNVKKIHDGFFFFNEKIKILEEMIRENIAKAREELHRKQF